MHLGVGDGLLGANVNHLGTIREPFGDSSGPWGPKPTAMWAQFESQTNPYQIQVVWEPFGAIWEPFGGHFGVIWAFGNSLGAMWDLGGAIGIIFGFLFTYLWGVGGVYE